MALLGALWGAGMTVVLMRGDAHAIPLMYTVISVATLQALAIGFNGLLFRIVRRSEQISAQVTEVRRESAVGDAVHQDCLARYRALSDGLVPLLNRLLVADDPTGDPATRVECFIESTRLRRMFDTRPSDTNPPSSAGNSSPCKRKFPALYCRFGSLRY